MVGRISLNTIHGYFLVFRYEGNSSFHIVIFDKTAIEIQYPPRKNCKLEDHQVEIVGLDDDDTNISPSNDLLTKHEVREKFVLKKLSIMSRGRDREQSKQPKSSRLKILLSWVSCGHIIW